MLVAVKFFIVLFLPCFSTAGLHNSSRLPNIGRTWKNGSRTSEIWDLFDHHRWLHRLDNLQNVGCKNSMDIYVKSLIGKQIWASKMFDASGHYNSPFFFGNGFWLGSLSLCQELSSNDSINLQASHFFVAKIKISNIAETEITDRLILLGQCLPKACKVSDVMHLLSEESSMASVLDVRAVPGDYWFIADQKFHIVCGFIVIILLLVTVASIIEIIQKKEGHNQQIRDLDISRSKEIIIDDGQAAKQPKNVYLRYVLAFSAVSNGKKILSVEPLTNGSISCLHGLRFLSIAWIIMVHTYLAAFGVGRNKDLRRLTETNFLYQTISNATFSVDTFFFISGFLMTFMFFRNNARKETKSRSPIKDVLKLVLMVTYRFLRLTPAYLFVLTVNEIVMKHIHSNSVFSPAIYDHVTCPKFWWRNVMYINNFFPQKEFCMLWSWYLANDFQFYLVASIFLIVATKNSKAFKISSVVMGAVLVASWVMTFTIAWKNDYSARVEQPFALFDELYDKPWMRIGPHLVGIATGYVFYKNNGKIKLHPLWTVLGWILSISCLASLVYGLGKTGLSLPVSAFYAALGHTAWGLSIAWITTACSSGYGSFLNSLFSCRLFLPLSRLTFCAYLVHPMMMCLTNFSLDGPIQLHHFFTMVMFFGNLVLSFITAFLISMGLEAPIVNILKLTCSLL